MGNFTIKVTDKTTGKTKEIQTNCLFVITDGGAMKGCKCNTAEMIEFLAKSEASVESFKKTVAKKAGIPISEVNDMVKSLRIVCTEDFPGAVFDADARA